MKDYEKALAEYVTLVQSLVNKHWQDMDFQHTRPTVLVDRGRVYDRVWKEGTQGMVHSFVRKSDGAVLKARSWKGPDTKHVRANIYDADHGRSGIEWTGAKYL